MSNRVRYGLSFFWVISFGLATHLRGAASAPLSFSLPPLLGCGIQLAPPASLTKEEQQLVDDEVVATIHSTRILKLQSLIEPGVYMDAPVEALRLVNPTARQTLLGVRTGALGRKYGNQRPSNRQFYRNPRIACASFVSYVLKKAGYHYGSASVMTLYSLVRKHGGKLVASRVSTRYTTWFPYYKAGDLIFFHRGSRLGHVEIYLGGGMTAGTSSSVGRVGIRGIGNRGFSVMTVVRL